MYFILIYALLLRYYYVSVTWELSDTRISLGIHNVSLI